MLTPENRAAAESVIALVPGWYDHLSVADINRLMDAARSSSPQAPVEGGAVDDRRPIMAWVHRRPVDGRLWDCSIWAGNQRIRFKAGPTDFAAAPSVPAGDTERRERIARLIALAGLGRTDGADGRAKPNERWEQDEWERRVLECLPGETVRRCYALADAIIADTAGGISSSLQAQEEPFAPGIQDEQVSQSGEGG